ncbi:MAG: lytic transglycosylase domain-containing protein [Chromatiaceae bacterium]|nr:lytic transglycosylase domain-containing protein [Chromatiaceae bacterium]
MGWKCRLAVVHGALLYGVTLCALAGEAPEGLHALAERIAREQGLDHALVDALIRAESAYDPRAVSSAGALGLMQLMPATAADYGVGAREQLFDPETNLRTGMRHLRRLLDRYGRIGPAVMAYNAGEGALERGGGVVRYPETQRYTHAVLTVYLRKKGIAPYSEAAQAAVGLRLTPAMARAGAVGGGAQARLQPGVRRPSLKGRLRSVGAETGVSVAAASGRLRFAPPRYVRTPPR